MYATLCRIKTYIDTVTQFFLRIHYQEDYITSLGLIFPFHILNFKSIGMLFQSLLCTTASVFNPNNFNLGHLAKFQGISIAFSEISQVVLISLIVFNSFWNLYVTVYGILCNICSKVIHHFIKQHFTIQNCLYHQSQYQSQAFVVFKFQLWHLPLE